MGSESRPRHQPQTLLRKNKMKILAEYTETTPSFTQQWNLVEVMGETFFTCCLRFSGDKAEFIARKQWEMEAYYPLVLRELRRRQRISEEIEIQRNQGLE